MNNYITVTIDRLWQGKASPRSNDVNLALVEHKGLHFILLENPRREMFIEFDDIKSRIVGQSEKVWTMQHKVPHHYTEICTDLGELEYRLIDFYWIDMKQETRKGSEKSDQELKKEEKKPLQESLF